MVGQFLVGVEGMGEVNGVEVVAMEYRSIYSLGGSGG
jgi:hypothetical protein